MRLNIQVIDDGDMALVHPVLMLSEKVKDLPASWLNVGIGRFVEDFYANQLAVIKHITGIAEPTESHISGCLASISLERYVLALNEVLAAKPAEEAEGKEVEGE